MTIPPQLAIIIEHHSRRSVLRLQGELDAANQDCLRRAICTVLDHHCPQILVLDLSELGFTDRAGLGAMVWAHKRLAEQGRELVLTGIQPLTRRLLGLTGLDTIARQHPEDPGQPGQEPIPAARRHERNRAPPDSGTSRWRTFSHAQAVTIGEHLAGKPSDLQ